MVARSAPALAPGLGSVPVAREAVLAPVAAPVLRDFVVAVDAGHGGKDPGARGRRGTLEKRVVLAIAKQVKRELDAVPGVRAVLIRSDDSYVDLRDRMQRARKQRANVFVSIHADAFRKSSAAGASVFVLSRKGATSESARWLAKQENAPFLAGGVMLVDKDDDLRQTLLDMSQTASHEAGYGVANAVLARLGKVTRLHAGRVERAGFLVLKSPDIPSILVETGFLSNPQEERKLRDPRHQKKLARAIRDGLMAYFSTNPPAGTLLAERKHVIKRGDTLSAIAQTYSISLRRLRSVNGIKGDFLRVGQVLRIPSSASGG
jgi:N-acetylmuramoyl-L-alanine amidase